MIAELNTLLLKDENDSETSIETPLEPVIATPVIVHTVRHSSRARSQASCSSSFADTFSTPRTSERSTSRSHAARQLQATTAVVSNRSNTTRNRNTGRTSPPVWTVGEFVEFTNNYRGLRGARGHITSVGTAFVSVRLIGRHSHLGIVDRGIRNVRRVGTN